MSSATSPAECRRCHRPLKAGVIGRRCAIRERDEAVAKAAEGFSVAQIRKAEKLIAGGRLVASTHPGRYRATSSDGTATYSVAWDWCQCEAARHELRCYHVLAVRMVSAYEAYGKAA